MVLVYVPRPENSLWNRILRARNVNQAKPKLRKCGVRSPPAVLCILRFPGAVFRAALVKLANLVNYPLAASQLRPKTICKARGHGDPARTPNAFSRLGTS
jgi:hypothetical protein